MEWNDRKKGRKKERKVNKQKQTYDKTLKKSLLSPLPLPSFFFDFPLLQENNTAEGIQYYKSAMKLLAKSQHLALSPTLPWKPYQSDLHTIR